MSGGKLAAGAAAAAAPQQHRPAAHRLAAADELGVLRVIEVPAGPKWDEAAAVAKWGEPNKEHAVHSLACYATSLSSGEPAWLAVGRKGRRLDVLDAYTGAQQASLTLPAAAAAGAAAAAASGGASSKVAVASVAFIPAAADRPLQLVAGTSDGMVSVCSCNSSSEKQADGEPQASGHGSSGSSSRWSITRSFAVSSNLLCLAVDSSGSHIVVGGEGIQPSIWDLGTGSRVWQGKGGKPNRVGLVDKPFTTALAFLPDNDHDSGSGDGGGSPAGAEDGGGAAQQPAAGAARRFLAGSVNAKLHLYDTAAGRRPQREAALGEARITCLAPETNGRRAWAANGTGHMQLLALDAFKLQDALKGAGGSVRALALHPDAAQQLVASVGLDRFLRAHDTSSRACRARVYLKQQLSAVAWLPVPQPQAAAAAGAAVPEAGAPGAAAAAAQHPAAGNPEAPGIEAGSAEPRRRGRGKAGAAGPGEPHLPKKRRKKA